MAIQRVALFSQNRFSGAVAAPQQAAVPVAAPAGVAAEPLTPVSRAHFGSQLAQIQGVGPIQFGRRYKKAEIPVLNLAEFTRGTPEQRRAFAQKMGEAFQKYGFIGLQGYDVPEKRLDKAYEAMKRFFALPEEVKQRYANKEMAYQRGFQPLGTEKKGKTPADQLEGRKSRADLKENIHIGRYGNPDFKEIPGLKATMEQFFGEMETIGVEVLKALDLYFGTKNADGRGYFESLVQNAQGEKIGWNLMRGINYPPVSVDLLPEDEKADFAQKKMFIRGGAHFDMNLITILPRATAAGLQLLTPGVDPKKAREKDWMDVVVPPKTVIVNAADMLSLMTEGTPYHIPSGFHRIVGGAQPRQSCVTFIHPDHDLPLRHFKTGKPIAVVNPKGEKVPANTGGEFVYYRLMVDLAEAKDLTPENAKPFLDKNRTFNKKA